MEHIQYKPKPVSRERKKLMILKYLLFTFNLLAFACSCVLLGVGIWMAVDRNFMTTLIGNSLYSAAVFMIIVAGGIVFIVSFFGCCGAITESIALIGLFFVVMCVTSLMLLLGGILAIAFRGQIGAEIKSTMTTTLTQHYGFNFESSYNRHVTDAWDRAQERLQCCAVETEGWSLYLGSGWYKTQIWTPEAGRPFVPQSCCVMDRLWRYINQDICQRWRLGPPGSPVDGAVNKALHYTGCYDAGYAYLLDNSVILIALGLTVGLLMIGGAVVSGMLIWKLKKMEKSGY